MDKYEIAYCISVKKKCPQKQEGLTILDAANKLQNSNSKDAIYKYHKASSFCVFDICMIRQKYCYIHVIKKQGKLSTK